MDRHKLRSHVFDKTGIKVDVDDPIFALVALNEAVLAETVERQLALLDSATQALAAQARAAGGLPELPPASLASHAYRDGSAGPTGTRSLTDSSERCSSGSSSASANARRGERRRSSARPRAASTPKNSIASRPRRSGMRD